MAEHKSPLENLMIMSQRLDQLDGQFDWSDEIQQIRAALSHDEGEAVGWMCVDENGVRDGEIVTHRSELNEDDWLPGFKAVPVYTHPAPQVTVPEGWTDRHTSVTRFALWGFINEGYHRANAAAQKGQPGTADDVAALLDDVKRAEEARNMLAAPTAPARDEREIAARALDEFRNGPLRSACLSYGWDTESDAYIVDRMLDEEASLLRSGEDD